MPGRSVHDIQYLPRNIMHTLESKLAELTAQGRKHRLFSATNATAFLTIS